METEPDRHGLAAPMAEIENRPSNFIRTRIDEDLASGKHATTHTRFPPEPNEGLLYTLFRK